MTAVYPPQSPVTAVAGDGMGARRPFGPTWEPLAADRPKAVVY
jgi:hypothetical protein